MIVKATDQKVLEDCYKESGNQLLFLYGKKDSEKEALFKQFVADKKCFYYRAREASADAQLRMMGQEIAKTFDVRLQENSYEEYFKRIKSNGPSKLVVIIDEASYVMKKDPSFFAALLKLKARQLYPGPVMILLTTSSVVWAEGTVLAEDGEYKKHIDISLKLEDFNFLDVVRTFPDFTVADAVSFYGVLGGVPGYMKRWNSKKSFKQNICELVLSEDGYLYNKAEELISSELRELSVYNTILATIASGKNKLNDLFLETGFSRAKISVYMKNLGAFDIVNKLSNFETGGWENAKKGVYEITDTYVNFWYCFIYPHLSDLHLLTPEAFYDRYIAGELDCYLSRYFTSVCKEYLFLLHQMKRLPISIAKMGSWIGKTGNLDIVAQSTDRRSIVGLCNWEKPEITVEMLTELEESMKQARVNAEKIYLFSAKSFAPGLVELAKSDARLELVDMKEL